MVKVCVEAMSNLQNLAVEGQVADWRKGLRGWRRRRRRRWRRRRRGSEVIGKGKLVDWLR